MPKGTFVYKYASFDFAGFSVVIEQNKHVAYAYLLQDKNIIGDVWLYNISETPLITDWSNKKNLPFKNPLPFLKELKPLIPAAKADDISVVWTKANDSVNADIYLRKQLLAQISSDEKIGSSTLVKVDGPLARVLM